jgi:hypothetical protein
MLTRLLLLPVLLAAVCAAAPVPSRAAGAPAPQDDEGRRETITGSLMGIGGDVGGRTTNFTLTLTGRTGRAQAQRYVSLLRRQGQEALRRQLAGRDLGRFSTTGSVGLPVNFVYEQPVPEGRRLIVLFERWLQPFELRYGTRSRDYPFGYMEISIDRSGRGSGTLIGAARVYFERNDPTTLTVENFSTYPVRVVNVEVRR